jgi:hypothetical protein
MFIRTKTDGAEMRVALPLTATSGKTRVKRRSVFSEYGLPVATCQTPFAQSFYIEWQIGYDVVVNDAEKLALITLPEARFTGANGKTKALYELSEYLFWLAKWGFVSRATLQEVADFLAKIPGESLLDVHPDLAIKRSQFVEKKFHGVPFLSAWAEYPLLVYRFGHYDILAEIITREKQRAVGVQPMLYLCFPITELVPAPDNPPLLGRPARSKEHADFVIHRDNAAVFVQLLRLFGMLSAGHRHDTLSIIQTLLTTL